MNTPFSSRAPTASAACVRVAIASRDGSALDSHFGSASTFVIYDVAPHEDFWVRTVESSRASDESGEHRVDSGDRNARTIASLAGCQIVFVLAVGSPTATQLLRAGIHPIKIANPESIRSVVANVQRLLLTDPPPWLRKALSSGTPRRMSFLDDEE